MEAHSNRWSSERGLWNGSATGARGCGTAGCGRIGWRRWWLFLRILGALFVSLFVSLGGLGRRRLLRAWLRWSRSLRLRGRGCRRRLPALATDYDRRTGRGRRRLAARGSGRRELRRQRRRRSRIRGGRDVRVGQNRETRRGIDIRRGQRRRGSLESRVRPERRCRRTSRPLAHDFELFCPSRSSLRLTPTGSERQRRETAEKNRSHRPDGKSSIRCASRFRRAV